MPNGAPPPLLALARNPTVIIGLDPEIVCAVIEQESSWDPWSVRYEPAFQRAYVDKQELDPTTTVMRSTSWGLMQIMGESAREAGFIGPLPSLCDPITGIHWGCVWLKKKIAEAEGDLAKGLLLWNGGGNPAYAAQVMEKAKNYEGQGDGSGDAGGTEGLV